MLDDWTSHAPDARTRDALLDLRAACTGLARHPMRAVRTFLRLRPQLRSRSYLAQHRIRLALERRIDIEITTPDACWRRPLRLEWNSLARTLDHARRDIFEQGRTDWDAIRARLVAKPTSDHGENALRLE